MNANRSRPSHKDIKKIVFIIIHYKKIRTRLYNRKELDKHCYNWMKKKIKDSLKDGVIELTFIKMKDCERK